jgi:hypothetical protein
MARGAGGAPFQPHPVMQTPPGMGQPTIAPRNQLMTTRSPMQNQAGASPIPQGTQAPGSALYNALMGAGSPSGVSYVGGV